MKLLIKLIIFLFIIASGNNETLFAQDSDTIDNWDNQMFISNKVAWSKKKWRYTGEFQIRLNDNTRQLDYYFIEGVASYMPNANWEVVPDLRFSVYPNKLTVRPGFGLIRKQTWKRKHENQLAHQMKYQADFESGGVLKHGFRYILFHNIALSDKFLVSSAAGGFYRWSENYTGIQFARAFTGLAYSFDKQHILSLSYFVGLENGTEGQSYIGGPIIQLVIRFDDDFKYTPAKYISF